MEKKYLKLDDIVACKIAFNLSNYVWNIVIKLDYFAKDTIGKQFVKSTDSISDNIGEGFGRYSKKDKIKFYRYSFGSVFEALGQNQKAKVRKLLNDQQYQHILNELQKLPKEIHHLISFTNKKLKT